MPLDDHLCPRCFKFHAPVLACYPVGPGVVSDPDVWLGAMTPFPEMPPEVLRHLARLAALDTVAREARALLAGAGYLDPAWKNLDEALNDLDTLGPATPPVQVTETSTADPDFTAPTAAEPDLIERLNTLHDEMKQFSYMPVWLPEIALIREAAAEIERLKSRCDHLRSQLTGTLAHQIRDQQTGDYEGAYAQAEGRISQALATWDRLWHAERKANDG